MTQEGKQPKLLGCAGPGEVSDEKPISIVLREEILGFKELLGPRLIVLCSPASGVDLPFLRACVETRTPFIAFLESPLAELRERFPKTEAALLESFLSIALAVYEAPALSMVDWADACLFFQNDRHIDNLAETATALGLPMRIIHAQTLISEWKIPADPARPARHGFADRKDLLDFFDRSFAPVR